MRKPLFLLFCLLGLFLFACSEGGTTTSSNPKQSSPMDRLPDNKAGETVRKAIDFVGGWAAWENKNTFSFYKVIEQIDSTGQVKKTLRQLHQYQLRPHFKARLSWEENEDQFVIINNGKQAKKYKNGKELTDDKSKNQAWNASFGSNYVVSMPFKLTDPGVHLSYDGIDTFSNKVVHAIKVEYEKGAGTSGGMHTWWYYFDENNQDLVAFYLDYGNGQSLTTYEKFETVDGIRIHNYRNSYDSNEAQEMVLLKTIYKNEEMKFDDVLDDELFEIK